MELTFDLALKIFITAFLGYLTLNTFFRYHFSIDRITVLYLIALFVLMVFYRGSTNINMFLITLGIFTLFYVILFLFSIIKKDFGFVLLNTFGKDFEAVSADLRVIAQKYHIALKNICYNKKKPFVLVIKNVNFKTIQKAMKELDQIYTKKKKRFTMYNYWCFVAFLIATASIWRF